MHIIGFSDLHVLPCSCESCLCHRLMTFFSQHPFGVLHGHIGLRHILPPTTFVSHLPGAHLTKFSPIFPSFQQKCPKKFFSSPWRGCTCTSCTCTLATPMVCAYIPCYSSLLCVTFVVVLILKVFYCCFARHCDHVC